jgi:hypothetical protein
MSLGTRLIPLALLLGGACSGGTTSQSQQLLPLPGMVLTPMEVSLQLAQLSHDSLRGRATGSPGAKSAAVMIARDMARLGLEPAGDSGYFQRVPIYAITDTAGRLRRRLAPSWAALDTIQGATRIDHVGTAGDSGNSCRPAGADSICNGADDDASGVVATLKIAQIMTRGERPRRTILFVAMTAEEVGLLGARWYSDNPVLPLASMAANLGIEMIGRPDSLAGGPGKAWLTGYERSTMGDMLKASGIPLVPDPRPDQNFFRRSDNYALALRGVVAHVMSSYNMHGDYHRPSDEASRADPLHMAQVIEAAARAVRLLSDGPKPEWKPGGKP